MVSGYPRWEPVSKKSNVVVVTRDDDDLGDKDDREYLPPQTVVKVILPKMGLRRKGEVNKDQVIDLVYVGELTQNRWFLRVFSSKTEERSAPTRSSK